MQPGSPLPQAAKGIGRAFGGALLFGLPLFLTMEMWRMGVVIPRIRLLILLLATMLLVVGLAHHFGFVRGERVGALGAVVEGVTAFAVGIAAAAVLLSVLSVARPLANVQDAISVIAIEALPAAVGASFARAQLGEGSQREQQRQAYRQELLVMTTGAVVLSSSVAPTEEVVLLAARMSSLHAVGLVAIVLVVMHAFVYVLEFKGGESSPGEFLRPFLAFTVVGYALAFAVSAYLLWTFGRYHDAGLQASVVQTVVLALPAGVGAAAARLIV